MPRPPRAFVADQALHIVQRGNNRSACFASHTDYATYLSLLVSLSRETGCAVHAYVLMTNHVHILLTPETAPAASMLMKRLAQRFSALINRKYNRTGTLWDGRFRASPVTSDAYVLACYQYIELNPVRAGMVEHPDRYRWSSHRANTGADPFPFLTAHPSYLALASARRDAVTAYRSRFLTPIDDAVILISAPDALQTTGPDPRCQTPCLTPGVSPR